MKKNSRFKSIQKAFLVRLFMACAIILGPVKNSSGRESNNSSGEILKLESAVRQGTINGPSSVNVNDTEVYTYIASFGMIGPQWEAANGQVLSTSISGTTYTATIKWTVPGSGSVKFYIGFGGKLVGTKNVTIANSINPGSISGAKTICYASSAGTLLNNSLASGCSGIKYQWEKKVGSGSWYSILGATSTSYSPGNLTSTTSYRRKASAGCGSAYSNTQTITVSSNIPAPQTPETTSSCGSTLLSVNLGDLSSGFEYYWQTSSGGTSKSNRNTYTVTTNGTYYLRAHNSSSQCWSSATSKSVTIVTSPSKPATPTISNNCGNSVLTRQDPPSGVTYYWQTSGVGQSTSNSSKTIEVTSGTHYLRARTNSAPYCWSIPSGGVTAAPNSVPGVPSSTNKTVCYNSNATLTASGISGATYKWYSSPFSTSVLKTGSSYTTPALTSSTSYYVSATVNGCEGMRKQVMITVNAQIPVPQTPLVVSNCGSSLLRVNLGDMNSGYDYYWQNASSGTSFANEDTYTVNSNGTYYLRAYNSQIQCWSNATSQSVTIVSNPAKPPTPSVVNSCGVSTLSRQNPPSGYTYYWQTSTTGESTTNSAATWEVGAGVYYLRARRNTSPFCWSAISNAVTAAPNSVPAMPAASNKTVCYGTNTTLSASGISGATYKWYPSAFSSTILGTGSSYNTPNLTSNTNYYVSATVGGCEGLRREVTVTVNDQVATPQNPIALNSCGSTQLQMNLGDINSGYEYYWQNTSTGTSMANENTYTVTSNGTYYLRAYDPITMCWSIAVSKVVNIVLPPTSPPTPSIINGCGVSTLTRNDPPAGVTYFWQTSSVGESTANSNKTLEVVSGMHYLRSRMNVAPYCWSAPSAGVTAVPKIIPGLPSASNKTLCYNENTTLSASGISGAIYKWYATPFTSAVLSTGSTYNTPSLTLTTSYYVSATVNGCEGSRRQVTVTVRPEVSQPQTPLVINGCGTSTLRMNQADESTGYEYYWQTSATGTSMSNPSEYVVSSNGTYYLRAYDAGTECWSNSTAQSVTITVPPSQAPTPTISNNCGTSTLTRDDPPSGYTFFWQVSSTGQAILNSNKTWEVTSGTYFLRARSNNIPYCWGPASPGVTATPGEVPGQPVVQDVSICHNSSANLTASGVSGATYRWYSSAFSSVVLHTGNSFTTPALTSATNYYVSAVINGCEGLRSEIEVSIKPEVPQPSEPLIIATCGGANLVVDFADLQGSQHEYYWQTTSGGTDKTHRNTLTVDSQGTYYLRSYDSFSDCWSIGQPALVDEIVSDAPPMPIILHGAERNGSGNVTLAVEDQSGVSFKWYLSKTGSEHVLYEEEHELTIYVNETSAFYVASVNACGDSERVRIEAIVNHEGDANLNWTHSYTYDLNGMSIGESKSFFDPRGRSLQNQVKEFTQGQSSVWATQQVYDALERPVISTMVAPINRSDFAYVRDFITTIDGELYNEDNFDKAVDSDAEGTLGWYYSTNNHLEPNTPISQFPYSRQEYSNDGSGELIRQAKPGEQFIIGSGHEIYTKNFALGIELDDEYLQFRNSHVFSPETNVSNPATLSGQGLLSVTRDANGKETVSYSDNEGRVLATGLSNGSYADQTVNAAIKVGLPNIYFVNLDMQDGGSPTPYNKVWLKIGNSANVQVYDRLAWETDGSDPQAGLIYSGPATGDELVLPVALQNNRLQVQIRSYDHFTYETLTSTGWKTVTNVQSSGFYSENTDFYIPKVENETTEITLSNHVNAVIPDIMITEMVTKYLVVDDQVSSTLSEPLKGGFYNILIDNDFHTLTNYPLSDTYDNYVELTYSYKVGNLAYNFYDDAGRLKTAISPNGVKQLRLGAPYIEIDKVSYDYNSSGQITLQSELDAGTTRFFYRIDGSLRFSQNSEQSKTGRFSYTNYDAAGRTVESGEYSGEIIFGSDEMESILEDVSSDGGLTGGSRVHQLKTHFDLPDLDCPRTQEFISGNVSWTENEHIKTWYSYDELGMIKWLVQDINGLGIKTVDYSYDYFGNVLKIAYQKDESTESFYHQFTYDEKQRISTVSTSTNESDWQQQAQYQYYQNGPLKSVVIADGEQTVDYIYTLNGQLKAINDINNQNGDYFAMLLSYFLGDYTSGAHPASDFEVSGFSEDYSGNISGITWLTQQPFEDGFVGSPSASSYKYDDKYQLTSTNYGSLSGGSFSEDTNEAFKLSDLRYDLNGNIERLIRRDESGNIIHNFEYHYLDRSNKLETVDGHGEYLYDDNGQMIQEIKESGEEQLLTYDVTGKVIEVRDEEGALKVSFNYDDRGFRLKKLNHQTNIETWYIRDAKGQLISIYDNGDQGEPVVQREIPIYGLNKIGIHYPSDDETSYELKDHLGNVRSVFRRVNTLYIATMESATAEYEEMLFNNIDRTRSTVAATSNHTPPTALEPNPNKAARLNGAIGKVVGPAKSLALNAGDKVEMDVYAKYLEPSGFTHTSTVGSILGSVVSAFGGLNGGTSEQQFIHDLFDGAFAGGASLVGGYDNGNTPKAYLNYIFFDENFQDEPVMGFAPVTEAGAVTIGQLDLNPHDKLSLNFTAEKKGYLYVFVANESNDNIELLFDDLTLTQTHFVVFESTDYYPYGSVMRTEKWDDDNQYRFGYQGEFSEKDEETGWNSFELRSYDATIARWLSVDPMREFPSPYVGMGNNPVRLVDPDGGCTGDEPCNGDDNPADRPAKVITIHSATVPKSFNEMEGTIGNTYDLLKFLSYWMEKGWDGNSASEKIAHKEMDADGNLISFDVDNKLPKNTIWIYAYNKDKNDVYHKVKLRVYKVNLDTYAFDGVIRDVDKLKQIKHSKGILSEYKDFVIEEMKTKEEPNRFQKKVRSSSREY